MLSACPALTGTESESVTVPGRRRRRVAPRRGRAVAPRRPAAAAATERLCHLTVAAVGVMPVTRTRTVPQ